jgi:hypothetical protein
MPLQRVASLLYSETQSGNCPATKKQWKLLQEGQLQEEEDEPVGLVFSRWEI